MIDVIMSDIGKIQKVGNDGRSIYIPKKITKSEIFENIFKMNDLVIIHLNSDNTLTVIPAEIKPK